MLHHKLRGTLLAGTAVGILFAGPAWAQQQDCVQRLDQIEQRIGNADLGEDRQATIMETIDSARTIGQSGNEQGCNRVVAELDNLMQTLEDAGELQAAEATGDQPAQTVEQSGQQQAAGGDQPAQSAEQSGQQQAAGGDQPMSEDASSEPQQAAAGEQTSGDGAEQGTAEVTAEVTIEQPQPKVTVRQQPPKITVHIPKPIVTIQMPEPDVQVEMQDPEVVVEMGEPQLAVESTGGQDRGQAPTQQANVTVETAEPEVTVEQEEPEVRFEQAGTASTGAGEQQAGGDEQSQALQAANQPSDQPAMTAATETSEEPAEQQAMEEGDQTEQDEPTVAATGQQPQQKEQAEQAEPTVAAADQQPQQEEEETELTDENPLAAMPASEVIGAEVQNQQGDTVAEIVDLVKRQGEEDLFAVLSVGGFLGLGDKEVVVPVNELQVSQEGEIVMVNASEDQLKGMPEYEEEGFESMAEVQ
jgi:hypothetical protein